MDFPSMENWFSSMGIHGTSTLSMYHNWTLSNLGKQNFEQASTAPLKDFNKNRFHFDCFQAISEIYVFILAPDQVVTVAHLFWFSDICLICQLVCHLVPPFVTSGWDQQLNATVIRLQRQLLTLMPLFPRRVMYSRNCLTASIVPTTIALQLLDNFLL